jgi:hypothetical protein
MSYSPVMPPACHFVRAVDKMAGNGSITVAQLLETTTRSGAFGRFDGSRVVFAAPAIPDPRAGIRYDTSPG